MLKISFEIIKQHFDSVYGFRWAVYSSVNNKQPFIIADVRRACFNTKFSSKKILDVVTGNNKTNIENDTIISSYNIKQYSYCDYEKLMSLKYPAAKLYMAAQCNMLLSKKTIFQYCNCSDMRTIFTSLEKSNIQYEHNKGLFLLHQEGYTLEEKLKYISERNINFIKKGSQKIILRGVFWEAQRCFSRCSGNCAVNSFRLATTSKKLHSGTAYEYIDRDRPCTYCRKFKDSPVAAWLAPIWEKYPVVPVKNMKGGGK